MREERKVSWKMRTLRIRRVDAWNLVRGMALLLACALMATGCATAVALRAPVAGPQSTCVTPAPEREFVVGVALSGGGSRAALFGASGLEALAQVRAPGGGSLLDQVTYLSSVSGGSLTASYYALNKPPRETAILGPDGALTDAYQTFFAGFKEKVSQDFESALLWRQVESFRWILNPALAAQSLSELFTERLLGPATFGDLSAREARGDSPRLIVNTTLYNNGRRLAMTTLPPDTGSTTKKWGDLTNFSVCLIIWLLYSNQIMGGRHGTNAYRLREKKGCFG